MKLRMVHAWSRYTAGTQSTKVLHLGIRTLSEIAIAIDWVCLQEEIHIKCNSAWSQADRHADILRELQNKMVELNTKKLSI